MLQTVLDRCCIARPGRFQLFSPEAAAASDATGFAIDLLDMLEVRLGLEPWALLVEDVGDADIAALLAQVSAEAVNPGERLLARATLLRRDRDVLIARLAEAGRLSVAFGNGGPSEALLKRGWSEPEAFGVWSGAPEAELRLPLPPGAARWRVTLSGQGLVGGLQADAARRLALWHRAALVVDTVWTRAAPSLSVTAEIVADGADPETCILRVALPDAVSPYALGLSEDRRLLCLAMTTLTIERKD
jgi:hypothetical protein